MQLQQQLRSIMYSQRLTIAVLSSRTGVPQGTLKTWLRGATPRNLHQVRYIANTLKIGFEELIFGDSAGITASRIDDLPTLFRSKDANRRTIKYLSKDEQRRRAEARRSRERAGGKTVGRPRKVDDQAILRIHQQVSTTTRPIEVICDEAGCGKSTYYRHIKRLFREGEETRGSLDV